jgi:hypothetical protein
LHLSNVLDELAYKLDHTSGVSVVGNGTDAENGVGKRNKLSIWDLRGPSRYRNACLVFYCTGGAPRVTDKMWDWLAGWVQPRRTCSLTEKRAGSIEDEALSNDRRPVRPRLNTGW